MCARVYANNEHHDIEYKVIQKDALSLKSDISSDLNLSSNLNSDVIHVVADKEKNTLFSTITPIQIDKSTYCTDATEYLKNIPGFSTIRYGGTNNDLVFRGMRGSHIRILTDTSEVIGVCCARMDPASSYINPETFDILNIIKGPQTVLYGPSVSGGVLQFQRYNYNFHVPKIQLHSNVTFGSNNSISKNIDSILGNKYSYIRLIGNVACSDDYYDGNNSKIHSAWNKWNADAILTFILNDPDTHVEINLGQSNGKANYSTKYMDGLFFKKENCGLKIETIDINDLLSKIELQTWYYHIHHLMDDNMFCANSTEKKLLIPSEKNYCSSCITDLNRFVWGIRSITTSEWNNVQCYNGIDAQINYHKKNNKYNYNYATNIYIKDIGIFSECTFNLLSNKKLIGGARIECTTINIDSYHRICNYNQVIYPTGFIRYENLTSPSLSYYIGIGTSQCFPDYWELISIKCIKDITKIYQIFQLKPEKTIQIDTGMNFKTSKIDGWISSYVGYIKDCLYVNNKNNLNNVNAQIFGSEIECNYKFNNYWCGKSNISWAWGMNVNNKCILPSISPLEGTLILQFQKNNYCLAASWRLVEPSIYLKKICSIPYHFIQNNSSNNVFNNDIDTTGFGVFSIYATWKGISQYITYSIGVNNIFNQSYIEYINKFNAYNKSDKLKETPIYEPGRTWWIKAIIKL